MTKNQFIHLYDIYFEIVSEFLSYYTTDQAELEDLVQEVFLRIWKYRESVDLSNTFLKSYLLKTARNVALTSITQKKKNLLEFSDEMDQHAEVNEETPVISYQNLSADYERALDHAPHKARMVYLMSREDGYTYGEIAESLQISPKTVEVHISKVLRLLRQQLQQYQF